MSVTHTGRRGRFALLLAGLAIALGYCLGGKLSLALAIPPGYATAVWPGAGVALAATLILGRRAWPWIWLGSCSVNLWTSFDGSTAASSATSGALAAIIGLGAVAQAGVGAMLIRQTVRRPLELLHERDIATFFVIGGPVSCLINATCGVGSLVLAGLIPASAVGWNWWTWWIGDTMGVLVFAPVVFMTVLGRSPLWKQRRKTVGVPLACALTVSIATFVYVSHREVDRCRDAFDQRAMAVAANVQESIDDAVDVLNSLNGLFLSSDSVTRDEFTVFCRGLFKQCPGTLALSWNQRVEAEDRPAIEQLLQAETGDAGRTVWERSAGGSGVPAGMRDEHVVVRFVEPEEMQARVVGFDVASRDDRRRAIALAVETGAPTATTRLQLVQDDMREDGLLIFLPFFGHEAVDHLDAARRRDLVRGYLTAVFHTGELVSAALQSSDLDNIQLKIVDHDADGEIMIYVNDAAAAPDADTPMWTGNISVAGRTWTLEAAATLNYLASNQTWHTWTVLAAGLLFTGLLGTFLLVLSGRTSNIEAVVAERTRLLEHRNQEMVQLAYAITHDLQTPVVTQAGVLSVLAKQIAGSINPDAAMWIARAQGACHRMSDMLDDLLVFSKAGHEDVQCRPIQVSAVVQEVLAELEMMAAAKDIALRPPGVDAWVQADRRGLYRVMSNLIGNSIKFMPEGRGGVVTVTTRIAGDRVEVRVTDNGPGIVPAQINQLFLPFKRLSKDKPGTGLGLAIVRRIIERFGGWVHAESDGRTGTSIVLDLRRIEQPVAPNRKVAA